MCNLFIWTFSPFVYVVCSVNTVWLKLDTWRNEVFKKLHLESTEFPPKNSSVFFFFSCGICAKFTSRSQTFRALHLQVWSKCRLERLLVSQLVCVCFLSLIFLMFCRINGSVPSNAEIRDNVLTFKGPVTYDLQGTYVCDATNSIGTRSGSVEVSIIGMFTWGLGSFDLHGKSNLKNGTRIPATITTSNPATALYSNFLGIRVFPAWLLVYLQCLFEFLLTYLCVFSVEKPLPQIATGDVISVIALLLAAGVLMGITITVLVLKLRSRKDSSSYVNSPLSLLPFASHACLSRHGSCPLLQPSSPFFYSLFLLDQKWFPVQKTVPADKEKTRRWYPGAFCVVFAIYISHGQRDGCVLKSKIYFPQIL